MCLQPGELAALVGPSGSGKSTLLDVLAGRKTVGATTGLIRYAGTAPTTAFLRRFTGYVEQDDTLIPNLTVAEMVSYTAALKLPTTTTSAERAARVGAVIDQLALAGCRDVRIGSVLARGISGGQAKRVNIALALVSRPKVLFLDEPTSGLDSYTSNKVWREQGRRAGGDRDGWREMERERLPPWPPARAPAWWWVHFLFSRLSPSPHATHAAPTPLSLSSSRSWTSSRPWPAPA